MVMFAGDGGAQGLLQRAARGRKLMQQVGEVGDPEVGGRSGVAWPGIEEQTEIGEHESELARIYVRPREQAAATGRIEYGHIRERPGGVTRMVAVQAI